MVIPVKALSRSSFGQFDAKVTGSWPNDISGHIFIVGPHHRPRERHLFVGTGVVVRWDLKAENGRIRVHSKPLQTWDGFWQELFPWTWKGGYFPASISLLGIAEIANTAVVKMDGRVFLTADAGRYWEIDPVSLKTITPVGYFDEHVITAPGLAFPMVMNTAHPFYEPDSSLLLGCELKARPRLENIWGDMVCHPYIYMWDGKSNLKQWKVDGVELDGSTHSLVVTERCVLVPDMPFQMGFSTVLGLKIPPVSPYPQTQIHVVDRSALVENTETVPARLVTFPGDSYHFLWNYRHTQEGHIQLCAIQQSTLGLTQAIEDDDINHFTGQRFQPEFWGIPWMFAFDPGILRKVTIKVEPQDTRTLNTETFIHPGWWSTQLFTADPREQFSAEGYSAIYQVYGGFYRDLLSRRQYLQFRDDLNRILVDEEIPLQDLPSVLTRIPLNEDWDSLTADLLAEQAAHPELPLASLGSSRLDFYVFPEGYLLDSVQFIPEGQGYILTTVLFQEYYEGWLFAANDLKGGAIAKISLPEGVNFGFTLHSEYLQSLSSQRPPYQVNRVLSAVRSLTKVPVKTITEAFKIICKSQMKRFR
ncbi:carotenoid oxygenase family protein [Fischerella sp. PCC 9605]|uniref:carotenoid oxygenase family protein n=1 Tax=Fischerella sp. PCC 9605 TaxID=1173024 RepID=UPI0004B673F0|nr:carotenoid oxygenase family protein [Fischerella sp. PCC 9605]